MARRPKIDYQGYEREISCIGTMLNRYGKAYAFYEEGKGFVFKSRLTQFIQDQMDESKLSLIGTYTKPLRSLEIIEDMKCELSDRFEGGV